MARRVQLVFVSALACGDDGASGSASTDDEGGGESSGGSGEAGDETGAGTGTGSESGSDTGGGTGDPEGHWIDLAPLPAPQQETAVVAWDDRIWVMGGFDGAGAIVATVLAYDPSADAWGPGPDLPVAMHHAQAAATPDHLVVAGFLTGNDFGEDGRVFTLERSAADWVEATAMPPATVRGGGAAAAWDDRIYVFGGLRQRAAVADAWFYDVGDDAWFPLPDLPGGPRDHLGAATVGDAIVVVGGRAGAIESQVAEVHRFDPGTEGWTELPAMPTARGGLAVAALDGWLFASGGEGNVDAASGVFAAHEALVLAGSAPRWFPLTDMPVPRHGTGAAALAGMVVIPGGADVQAFGAVATVQAWVVDAGASP